MTDETKLAMQCRYDLFRANMIGAHNIHGYTENDVDDAWLKYLDSMNSKSIQDSGVRLYWVEYRGSNAIEVKVVAASNASKAWELYGIPDDVELFESVRITELYVDESKTTTPFVLARASFIE